MPIDEYREILDALNNIKVKDCENCGSENWNLPHVLDDKSKPELLGISLVQDFNTHLRFAPLTCHRCGNTRLIHVHTLLKGKSSD